ncbi:MAG: MATE family efflux transporter [Planctomycetota bacterium]
MTRPDSILESKGAALREILRIGLPAVITMTSYTAMQFVDTWIVSRLGAAEVAGVGHGGIAAFLPQSIMFGLLGVVSTFVSQNLGAGKPERGACYAWNGLWLSTLSWLIVIVPYAIMLPALMDGLWSLLGEAEADPRVREVALGYGQILLFGCVFTVIARTMAQYFYGMHRPNLIMVSTVTAVLINIPLTYGLVTGSFGLPEMGYAGAAVGTVIAGFIEGLIPLAVFVSKKYRTEFGTLRTWKPCLPEMRDIVRIGWPAAVMMGNEIFCWWIFMQFFVGRFGVASEAAAWIVLRYMHLSFMPAVGIMQALSAVVGRVIGAGRRDLVASRTAMGVVMCTAYMGFWGIIFVGFGEELARPFSSRGVDPALADEVVAIGARLFVVAAAFQVFDALAISVSGSLRGAGDTVWPGMATLVTSWVCILGLGYAAVEFVPQWGPVGPWIGAAAYVIVLSLLLAWRFLSGGWKRIELVDRGRAAEDGEPRVEMGMAEAHGAEAGPSVCEFDELAEGHDRDRDRTVEPVGPGA